MKTFVVVGSLDDGQDGGIVGKLVFAAVDVFSDVSVDFRVSRSWKLVDERVK